MTTEQLEFTETELLATHDLDEPLVAGGVRCHGGFDGAGAYVSPRTLNRAPAIEAWQAQHRDQFGTDLLSLPLDTWPEHYPNEAQAKHLIAAGAPEPIVSTLTRIGTVEGFGAMIRHSPVPDLQAQFDEEIRGTAMSHLDGGLYEAHARDEAGFEDEGGHQQMWFAARDIAFEHPVTEDETDVIMERMGILPPKTDGRPDPEAVRARMAQALERRVLGDDFDFTLEMLIERMARLLLIEISAFHAFAWAEEVLADTDLVAGEGEAARLVSYIRADETPHVEYLKTVLSEMRDRTFIDTTGTKIGGVDVIGPIWDRALAESVGIGRDNSNDVVVAEIERTLGTHSDGDAIFEGYQELATLARDDQGRWRTLDPTGGAS